MALPLNARFNIPDLPQAEDLLPFLRRIDVSRWYSNFGPLVCDFEERFLVEMAAAHGLPKLPVGVTTVSTCYHALALGLKFLGVGEGGKVLVPAITFPACPLAVTHIGAQSIFADVDIKTWQLTPAIARVIAAKTKIDAVMPVAVYGAPVPADEWDTFTKETGIPVIIDAAAAVESQRYPQHARCLVAHSLHALKPFGIGEGGLLLSSDAGLIHKVREYSNFGTHNRIACAPGENTKLSEYHAAVALAQLQRWGTVKARRAQVYEFYKKAWRELSPPAKIYAGLDNAIVSNFMFRLEAPRAAAVIERLQAREIFAHHTYLPPLYRHPHYLGAAVANADGAVLARPADAADAARLMPQAEALNNSVLGLPFHALMTEDVVRQMVAALCEAAS